MNPPNRPMILTLQTVLPTAEGLTQLLATIQALHQEVRSFGTGFPPKALTDAEGTILLRAHRGREPVAHHLAVSHHHYQWVVDGDHRVRRVDEPDWMISGARQMAVFLGALERFLGRFIQDVTTSSVAGAPSREGEATAFLDALTGGGYSAYYRRGVAETTVVHAETAGHQVSPALQDQIRSTAARVRSVHARAIADRQRAAGTTVPIDEAVINAMLDAYEAPAGGR